MTSELAEHVRVVAWNGIAFIASDPVPAFLENSSAIIRWGVDIPSPMKRNMYLGSLARSPQEAMITATRNIFFIMR